MKAMLDGARRPAAREPAAVRGPFRWAQEGMVLARAGDLLGALQCFQRPLEGDADCRDAWLGLSDVFMVMQDPRRSERCLQVARRIHNGFTRGTVMVAAT